LAHVPGIVVGLVTLVAILPLRLLLERLGLSHLVMLVLLSIMSAVGTFFGLFIMPAAIRPLDLFRQLSKPIHRFPPVMRMPLLRILGVAQ